ncbi:MAG: hypothetical protein HC772_05750 [Leptolyngbyaceae cyanobacterium CRU_2_3]|nr:hypothetical protein [Leptolyngbyaceae cyanobacterium CRU_2_3]
MWAARSLAALWGVAAIPALFGLGWITFRCCWAGQAAAALMAISPYGVYLAQEARHYTLAVLLIVASLSCLITTVRHVNNRTALSLLVLCWLVIQTAAGVARFTIFFSLVLGAEAVAWLGFWFLARPIASSPTGRRLWGVAISTLMGVLVWVPVWRSVSENELTQWIYDQDFLSNAIEPLYRLGVWMITMVALLPVEGVPLTIAIFCGAIVLISAFWLVRITHRGLQHWLRSPDLHSTTLILIGFWLGAIALMLGLTYGIHADLTIAARYQFIYFPAVIVLVGGAIASAHNASLATPTTCKVTCSLPLILGFLGSLTVITNYGYQKPDRPDQLVPLIRETAQVPVLIATAHQTHEQIRELMGLALEYQRQSWQPPAYPLPSNLQSPRFLLAHLQPHSNTAVEVLQHTVEQLPRPFDLWTVNFLPVVQPEILTCTLDTIHRPLMHGYDYRLYHC